MNIPVPPSGLHPEDYDRIEAAVMETVRGRWFLLEYARRQRAAETGRLVQAIDRLERYVSSQSNAFEAPAAPEPEGASIDRWRRRTAVRARDLARALRERGLDEDLCAQAEALAGEFADFAGEAKNAEEEPAVIAAPIERAPTPEVQGPDGVEVAAAREAEILTPAELSAVDPRLAALSRLDHLSLDEKLVLFG